MTTNNAINAPLPLTVANGGTGIASGTSGGIPYFSSSSAVASSGALTANTLVVGGGAGSAPTSLITGTTTTVLHGNPSGLPSWGAVSLSAEVTGTLPVGSGGTGLTSGTSGGIPYFSAINSIASSGVLTNHALVLGGGAGSTPTSLSAGTSTTILHGNASGAPTWSAVSLTADVSGVLPIANGGTNATSYSANGLIYQNSGNTGFTNGADLTYSAQVLSINTSSANPQVGVTCTLTGSSNSASYVLSRGDLANGSNIIYFATASSPDWLLRQSTNSSDITFSAFSASKEVLTLGLSTFDVTIPNGNLIFSVATKGLQLTHAAVSAGTANATLVTGVVLSSGASGTINNSAVTTSHIGFAVPATKSGTLGSPYTVTCNSGSFSVSGGSLDNSTLAVLFIKSL